jgi:hypothetical protein
MARNTGELGHCAWRTVVLVYVPTAQTVIAQGVALGMQPLQCTLAPMGNAVSHFRLRFSCQVREVFFVLEHLFS